jgi:DnaK suppressor protein
LVTARAELSDQQLRELAADLSALQQELEARLGRAEGDSGPVILDQQRVGRLSRMDAMQQQQMARASQAQASALLNRVNLALQAIAEGEFGWCRDCDQPIGYARLKARPDSPLCVVCQARNEN